ncbi:unnamed protein product [Penicillium olsonii]|nr:unnamed protein product [Penicillium olsonii]
MLDRKDTLERCHTNTCQWILDLEKYRSWSSEPRGLLWITGKPGAGKSTLMAFLHDQIKSSSSNRHGIQLDFFFTARGTELQRTPLGMFRSLVNQLFIKDATTRQQIRETYRERREQFGYVEGDWSWPQAMLESLLEHVVLASSSQQLVTIFVDALDETGADSGIYLVNYFHRLLARADKRNATVRICISCRHYPILISVGAVEISVEEHNRQDIAIFVRDSLAQPEVDAIECPRDDMRRALISNLIDQANGVWQWARLIVPYTRQRLNEAQPFQIIYDWLREIPVDLEDMYQYILSHVIQDRNLKESLQLFQWLCLAERPLTLIELRYALASGNVGMSNTPKPMEQVSGFIDNNHRMKLRIKVLSAGLAEVVSSQDSNEIVQVVHKSVSDFLHKTGLAFLSDVLGAISPLSEGGVVLQSQAILYRSCLTYLSISLYSEDLLTHDDKKSENYGATRLRLSHAHPFLAYATLNVFIHARKAGDCRGSIMWNEEDILSQVESHWVSLHRLFHPWEPVYPPKGTALIHIAAAANLVDVIERLSSTNMELLIKDEDGNTALHIAARHGHITVGRILRRTLSPAECESTNLRGRTPLTEAASFGQLEFVEWLLRDGAQLKPKLGQSRSPIHEASLGGHRDIVKILLATGADVNTNDHIHGNALHAAIRCNLTLDSSAIVKMLLDAGVDCNAQNGEGQNALLLAASLPQHYNKNNVMKMLINAGADVNAQGREGDTALQAVAASFKVHSDSIRLLLDAGANVNMEGGTFGTALQAAVSGYGDQSQSVRLLLAAGANVNAQGGEFGNALQSASYRPGSKVVRILLDAGAIVNAKGGLYGTALQAAAYHGSSEIVQMLLDSGADPNAQRGVYSTALQAAAYRGSNEIVRMLLDAGADVNTQGGKCDSALQAAAYEGNSDVVQTLLRAGADANAQGGGFGNSLQAAAFDGSSEIVHMLLKAGADPNIRGGLYGTPLQAAAYGNNSEITQILLDAGADSNVLGGHFGSSLEAAAYQENKDILQMLLTAGADPNAQGGLYGTSLQAAAFDGSSEIVHMLLDAGADVNAKGGAFGNAVQAAAYTGSSEIVQILIDAGADVIASSGIYVSCFSSAVSLGLTDLVRILLEAGANISCVDELNQTPLHHAASANRVELLREFPVLLLPIDERSRLLQTPLHVALHRGHLEFAEALIEAGADPFIPDAYGKNALDWVVGNESLVNKIRILHPSIVVTAEYIQYASIRRSIIQISETLIQSQLHFSWILFRELGRYLSLLGEIENARLLLQLNKPRGVFIPKRFEVLVCHQCENILDDVYFFCKICPYMNLCGGCAWAYPSHGRLYPNQEHKTFKVTTPRISKERNLSVPAKLTKLLKELSEPKEDRAGKRPPIDYVAHLQAVSRDTSGLPFTLLGLLSISSFIFVGLMAAFYTC